MKKLLRIAGIGIVVLLVIIGGAVGYFSATWPPTYPDTPKPDITASDDPEVIARGEYLFHAVAACTGCHTNEADFLALEPGGKLVPRGGFEWKMGPLGTIRSANITPDEATGIGKQTDGEIARAMRNNVKADGSPAFFMFAPGPMADEDLTAIISYMRTMEPVAHEVPPSEVGLMGKILFQGPMAFFASPKNETAPTFVREGEVSVERGRYLFEGPASCAACHTEIDWDGESLNYVGQIGSGRVSPDFPDPENPEFVYVPPNLTKDPDTGIMTGWSEEQFVTRIRTGRNYKWSPMPYESYRLMTDEDLKSIYAYIQQLPPTKKDIGAPYRRKGEES